MYVLVLTGEAVAARIICRLLEGAGHEPFPVETVGDALGTIATAQFDAFVVDLDDVGMRDGGDPLVGPLLAAAGASSVPVIGVCREACSRWQHYRSDRVLDRLLVKPLNADELASAVDLLAGA